MSQRDGLTFEEIETLLAEAEFADCRLLWHSSNYVYLAQLKVDDDTAMAAIYKPLRGETPLWDFPSGLYKREVAAYRLAKLLGWEFVPPTVARDGPEGVGSLQLFVPHDPKEHFFEMHEVPELVPQLMRIAAFDYVANNADRKGGHCLLDEDRHIWGIDHGLCFHEQYKMRTVIWDWSGDAVPGPFLEDIEAAARAVEERSEAATPLLELLSGSERTQLLVRAHKLLADGVFPAPGPHRHYPWPLV